MAINITAGTDRTFNLEKGGIVNSYQRGMYEVYPLLNGENIEIIRVGDNNNSKLLGSTPLTEINGGAFADYQALITFLEPFFFRSISGGGGGGVTSVNGDVGPAVTLGTDDIPNDSTVTGVNTSNALDELQQGVGANAVEIVNHVSDISNPHATSVENLGDTVITTPANSEVLTFTGGVWRNLPSQGFDPVANGVLTEYLDNQNSNLATSNATLPSLTTYLTLVDTSVDINSDYRFTVAFSISHSSTNSNAVVDIKDFGTTILPQVYTVEPKDNSNRTWVTLAGRFTPNPLGGGQVQLQLDFGTDNAANSSTMFFANISLQKINE